MANGLDFRLLKSRFVHPKPNFWLRVICGRCLWIIVHRAPRQRSSVSACRPNRRLSPEYLLYLKITVRAECLSHCSSWSRSFSSTSTTKETATPSRSVPQCTCLDLASICCTTCRYYLFHCYSIARDRLWNHFCHFVTLSVNTPTAAILIRFWWNVA